MNGNEEILEEILLHDFRALDERGKEAVLAMARIQLEYLMRPTDAPVSL